MAGRPPILLLCGPSGSGKNTVADLLKISYPEIHHAKGMWDRPHRPGENDDTADSIHVPTHEFEAYEADGLLTAVARVHGHLYGTPKMQFSAPLDRGQPVLRIVTIWGARAVMSDFAHEKVVLIYMNCPISTTAERLLARGDDDDAVVRRLETAELEAADPKTDVDYMIDADRPLNQVFREVKTIIGWELSHWKHGKAAA